MIDKNTVWLIIFGLFGQFLYFLRFFIQWYLSEKHKKVIVPTSFWVISIWGAIVLLIYSIVRRDIVFIIGAILSFFMYVRNLLIDLRSKNENKK